MNVTISLNELEVLTRAGNKTHNVDGPEPRHQTGKEEEYQNDLLL